MRIHIWSDTENDKKGESEDSNFNTFLTEQCNSF